MTCREKLTMEHPELVGPIFEGGCKGCPNDYGYTYTNLDICTKLPLPESCIKCWNREIPEEKVTEGSLKKLGKASKRIAESAVKAVQALDDINRTIKDSGDRTEFESGAVRDMREGKGRFDLMPLEVVAEYIRKGIGNPKNEERYWFFKNIVDFQKTNNTDFLYCAMTAFEPSAFEYTSTMLLEVAKHFEEGAKKYGPDNWRRGIPVWCYIDSAVRHYLKWLDGQTDERHDRAVMWNLMCCIWEVDYRPKDNKED